MKNVSTINTNITAYSRKEAIKGDIDFMHMHQKLLHNCCTTHIQFSPKKTEGFFYPIK